MARYARLAKASAAFLLLTLAACGGKEEAVTDLTIDPGFVRMPAEGALSTAAYLEITSPEDDRLLAATSPMATVEIHTMTMHDGVMTMRKLDVLELPAGETVALEPSSYAQRSRHRAVWLSTSPRIRPAV